MLRVDKPIMKRGTTAMTQTLTPNTQNTIFRHAGERGRTQIDWLDSWHTFSFGDYVDPHFHNFGHLRVINDDIVAPAGGFATHGHKDMEIITIVLEGKLAHKDSLGNGSTITPGEVQRMSAGTGILHSEFNPSQADPVHLLQIWITPNQKNVTPSYEQTTFDLNQARNQWQLLASESGDQGSVTIHQDAQLFQAFIPSGDTLTYDLPVGRQAWLHVIEGPVQLNNMDNSPLNAGDAVGITETGTLRLTANESSHVLLFNLAR